MAPRTERIEARVDPARAERIRFASSLLHISVSGFVIDAASEKAEQVIAEASYTDVPSDYFDRLLAALDAPPTPIAALARAGSQVRRDPAFKQV
jgi:uncharacterized protein (DUF1778 family)